MSQITTLLLLLTGALPGAVVIDRVAAIVGKHVVKSSDIQRDLRLTEFLNRDPADVTTGATRKAAERLIDQTIIRDEIARGGYRRPTDGDAGNLLKALVQDRFGGSDGRLREALARYSLGADQLRDQLLWQLTVLRFIDQRFRPGVQVSDEDVRAYYDQHLGEFKRDYPRNSSFGALQARIRDSLEGQRVNEAFTAWLDDARKQARIEYREGAFQ
jgi:hypothetical protein